jgi:hypothetical protein
VPSYPEELEVPFEVPEGLRWLDRAPRAAAVLSVVVLLAWVTCGTLGLWRGLLPELTVLLWVALVVGELGSVAVGLVHLATTDGRYGAWIVRRLAALVVLAFGAIGPPVWVMALFGR